MPGSTVIHGIPFAFVAAIQPERNDDGSIREFQPHLTWHRRDELPLLDGGEGPFCRFSISRTWCGLAGVYAFTVDEAPVYVGRCVDLAQRINTGYGSISPRNCFEGGQSTNVRINHSILLDLRKERRVVLWFHETTDSHGLEAMLIETLRPAWNRVGSNGSRRRPQPALQAATAAAPGSAPGPAGHAAAGPRMADFTAALESIFADATSRGAESVEVRAGALHRSVGGYPGPHHRTQTCCDAMRRCMQVSDEVLSTPPKGRGASLTIRYRLPRTKRGTA